MQKLNYIQLEFDVLGIRKIWYYGLRIGELFVASAFRNLALGSGALR